MQLSNRQTLIHTRWLAILITAALAVAVFVTVQVLRDDSTSSNQEALTHQEPAVVERIEDSDLSRVILSERAAERLQIQTEAVRTEQVNGSPTLVIPFSAVYYAPTGEAWVYTNPEPLTYIRHSITVDRVEGELTYLSDGPPAQTNVVTVGVAELYGTEYGIGH